MEEGAGEWKVENLKWAKEMRVFAGKFQWRKEEKKRKEWKSLR